MKKIFNFFEQITSVVLIIIADVYLLRILLYLITSIILGYFTAKQIFK